MKINPLLASLAVLTVSSCSYPILTKDTTAILYTAKSCSYAPLWLAPLNSHYSNVDSIAKASNMQNIASVEQVIYPFVLFTKSCVIVKGN